MISGVKKPLTTTLKPHIPPISIISIHYKQRSEWRNVTSVSRDWKLNKFLCYNKLQIIFSMTRLHAKTFVVTKTDDGNAQFNETVDTSSIFYMK